MKLTDGTDTTTFDGKSTGGTIDGLTTGLSSSTSTATWAPAKTKCPRCDEMYDQVYSYNWQHKCGLEALKNKFAALVYKYPDAEITLTSYQWEIKIYEG